MRTSKAITTLLCAGPLTLLMETTETRKVHNLLKLKLVQAFREQDISCSLYTQKKQASFTPMNFWSLVISKKEHLYSHLLRSKSCCQERVYLHMTGSSSKTCLLFLSLTAAARLSKVVSQCCIFLVKLQTLKTRFNAEKSILASIFWIRTRVMCTPTRVRQSLLDKKCSSSTKMILSYMHQSYLQ